MIPSGTSRPLNTRSLLEDNSQTNRQVLHLTSWMAPSLSRLNILNYLDTIIILVALIVIDLLFSKADIRIHNIYKLAS
jgi:hypothetical protein